MKYKVFILLIFIIGLINGCGDDSPMHVTTQALGGYVIELSSTAKSVKYGGQLQLFIMVKDANGNMVTDTSNPVIVTSRIGGKFLPANTVNVVNGIANVVYIAPTAVLPSAANIKRDISLPENPITIGEGTQVTGSLPEYDVITATYKGAIAKLPILLYK